MAKKLIVSDFKFNLIRGTYILVNIFLPPVGSWWSNYLHSRKNGYVREKNLIVTKIAHTHKRAAFLTTPFLLYTLTVLATITEVALAESSFFASVPYIGFLFGFVASLLTSPFSPIAIFFMLFMPILVRALVSISQHSLSITRIPYLSLFKEAFIGENLKIFYEIQKDQLREKPNKFKFAPTIADSKIDKSQEKIFKKVPSQKKYLVVGCGKLVSTDFRMRSKKYMHPEHLHDEYETLDMDKKIKPTYHADIHDEKQIKEKLRNRKYNFIIFERFHGDHQNPKKIAEIASYLMKKDGMLAFIAIGKFQFKLLSLIENMRANGLKSLILGSGLNCFFFKEEKKEALKIFSSYLNEPYIKKFISGESFFISDTNNGTCFDKKNFENLSWDLDEILLESEELLATKYISHENVLLAISNRRLNHTLIENCSKKIYSLLKEEKSIDSIEKISLNLINIFMIKNRKKEKEYDLIGFKQFLISIIKKMTKSEIALIIDAVKMTFSNENIISHETKGLHPVFIELNKLAIERIKYIEKESDFDFAPKKLAF